MRGESYITMSIGFIAAGIILNTLALIVFYKVGFRLGVRQEQQARIRRAAALAKLLQDK